MNRGDATPNKLTLELGESLQELSCDPIKGMVDIASTARKTGNLQLAGQMYKELAQYLYPKRKAIEVIDELDNESVTEVTIHVVDASRKDRKRNEQVD